MQLSYNKVTLTDNIKRLTNIICCTIMNMFIEFILFLSIYKRSVANENQTFIALEN